MSDPEIPVLCGSLSKHPVSMGAAMHRAGYAALGLNWTYVPFECRDLAGALAGMRALGIRGFGVSMPFKLDIMPHLDRIDDLAARIGAVNTVVNDDGTLVGHNTDAWGSARALAEALSLEGKRAVVIGAGGAARAVAFSLAAEGMSLHLVNRTPDRAQALAKEIADNAKPAISAGGLDDLDDLSGFDAVVNASSAGMTEYGPKSLVPESALREGLVVMDIVYKPIETEMLAQARHRGAIGVHGGRMLLHQAARQFELYTGKSAPLEAMDEAIQKAISA